MEEIWREINWIPNLRGTYEVSNMGNVRRTSLIRYDNRTNTYQTVHKIRLLSLYDNGHGYLHVSFPVDTENGRKLKNYYVHRLVAQAFIENPDNKSDINHKNFIRTDNKATNLEWVSFDENMKHSASMDRRMKPHYPSSGSYYKTDLSIQRDREKAIRKEERKQKRKMYKSPYTPKGRKKPIQETNIHYYKGKYIARICHNKKRYYVGCFDTFEEAVKAKTKMLQELGLM